MSTAADTATILIMAVVLLAVGYWFGSWIAGQEREQLDALIGPGPDPEPVELKQEHLAMVEVLPGQAAEEEPEPELEEAPTGVLPVVESEVPAVLHQIRWDLRQVSDRLGDLEERLGDLEERP